MMGIQMMEQGRVFGIEKFVAIGTVCAYPKFTPVPFKEVNLWDGYPEETNAPYGIAKKMLLVQALAYKQQYDFNAIYLLPVNLYGPRENFDLETSHVIPAIIRKCLESHDSRNEIKSKINSAQRAISESQSCIKIWGTGNPTREFLYVEDAAEGIILATEKYNKTDPVNLGSGSEISIKELVKLIVKLTNFKGNIVWDTSKPDGQPRRRLDTTKAEKEFGFKAKTSLEEGLMQTIEWYMKNKAMVVC